MRKQVDPLANTNSVTCQECGGQRYVPKPMAHPYTCLRCRKGTETGRVCTRCQGRRWSSDPREPFVCQRCREVLAGLNAIDPKVSEAQLARLAKIRPDKAARLANLRRGKGPRT